MKIAKEISIILGITWVVEIWTVELEDVDGTGKFLLDNMSPMFIPAGVGLIRYFDQIKAVGVPYLLINLVSTVIVFVVTGKIAQLVMEKTGREGK